MAEKQAGGLSLRIGLTLSQLQSDFLAAEQTVRQGMAALNRQQNLIKLRMETDTAGLDQLKDATKIIEIRERSLTQLLEMQKDRLTLATKAYQDYSSSKNANAVVSKNLETAVERERLALARLEAQLKNLSTQKISIDTRGLQSNIDKITAKIQNVRLQAVIDTSKLKGANTAFDAQKIHIAAVTKELELQRQKLVQLQAVMAQSAKATGADSLQSLNLKSNILQQIQQINQLEFKLKELQNTKVDLQFRVDSMKQAEQRIQENIAQINARLDNIRIKTDIDMSRLGAAISEFNKAKIQIQSLNRELDLEKQKLAELQKAMYTSASKTGINSSQTLSLRSEVLKQIQAIDQLKAKIAELNKIQAPKNNDLLSRYLNIKGDVVGKLNEFTSAFSSLQNATSSADNAITASLSVIGTIPHPVGRAVAALASMPIIFKGIENSLVDMTRAAAASGDAVYVMSRGMQMSLNDAGKFTTNAKVAGTEVNSLKMAIQQVQRQIVKGGDDSRAAEWLKRYGESARDANGNLKNLNDMTFALSRALHKAQEEGKGAEFVFSVFRNISADDITAIEDWSSVSEQAAVIVKNGLANPALAHEVKGDLNALAVQEAQLKATFESALLPVADEIIPRLTERAGKLTQILADNKDVIKEIGNDLASIWGGIETVVDRIGDGVGFVGGVLKDVYMAKTNAENRLIEKYKNDTDIKTAEDLFKKELYRSYLPTERAIIEASPYRYEQELKKYEPIFKARQDARKKIAEEKKALADEMTSVADISSAAASRRAVEENPEILKQAESLKKILQETSDIQYKLSHTDYENKRLDILQWQQDMLNQAEMTEEKRIAIERLGEAKLAQLEKENAEKIQEYWKKAADIEFELTHSAFEKQLRDIEEWEEAQRKKASTAEEIAGIIAESAAKEAQAFEREVERIKGKIQSLEDKIFEQEHSQYENDIRRLQQERIKLYQEGIYSTELIERYYQNALGKLNTQAAKGGDYTKSPEGTMQRGGNGIMLIEGDQIIDDGLLRIQQQEIKLLANENRIREQLSQSLNQQARDLSDSIQATKELAEAQKQYTLQTQQEAGGYQVIEGDQAVSGLQEFNSAVQDTTATLELMNQPTNEFQNLSATMAQTESDFQESLRRMSENLPVGYFKNLADNAEAVSKMQFGLTTSTMKLADAQDKLRAALENLPKFDSMMSTSNQQSPNGLMNLSTPVSDIPQRDREKKFGFDWDVFGGLAGLAALIPHPAAKALAIGGAIGAGAGVGTFGNADDRLKSFSDFKMSDFNLSEIITPLNQIDSNVQSILQSMSQKMQEKMQETIPLETIVTPLNNLQSTVDNILSALGNGQPPQINVSPSISNNLGGAYVFDNEMKKALIEDITREIVDNITQAVKEATSKKDYGYSA